MKSSVLVRPQPQPHRADAGLSAVLGISSSVAARNLAEAVGGLRQRAPELSAATGLWPWQTRVLLATVFVLPAGQLLAPESALLTLLAVMAFPFLCVVLLRIIALRQLLASHAANGPLPAASDEELPVYTVLVPLFREAKVVRELLASLQALDYPPARLEVMLIVEEIDAETRAAVESEPLPPHMQVLVVPAGAPQTKPRAIQYALQFATGEYVVVYDAEDAPEPGQLRRALAALKAGGPHLGCLQAQLNIYNSQATWFTRGIVEHTPQEVNPL